MLAGAPAQAGSVASGDRPYFRPRISAAVARRTAPARTSAGATSSGAADRPACRRGAEVPRRDIAGADQCRLQRPVVGEDAAEGPGEGGAGPFQQARQKIDAANQRPGNPIVLIVASGADEDVVEDRSRRTRGMNHLHPMASFRAGRRSRQLRRRLAVLPAPDGAASGPSAGEARSRATPAARSQLRSNRKAVALGPGLGKANLGRAGWGKTAPKAEPVPARECRAPAGPVTARCMPGWRVLGNRGVLRASAITAPVTAGLRRVA
ncbi:MAG: hypothetical protein JWP04_4004 [Belnapia sp.]|nr:hypothetical protein [Belnapia sp.]